MKKLLLAILGLAFAFFVSSCNEKNKKQACLKKNQEKQVERHHDRW
jgi:hypothetical protein